MVLPGLLEATAIAITVASVLLSVKRSIWQYPTGLVGVVLFAKVFIDFGLYSSAALQAFFFAVQLYGWWFWLYGDNGRKPRITVTPLWMLGIGLMIAGAFGIATGTIVGQISGAALPIPDALILGFSLFAQFLLDRKKIETWIIWALVNIISIPVYFSQGLEFTAYLYCGLLANTAIGYYFWHKELKGYNDPSVSPFSIRVWEKGTEV